MIRKLLNDFLSGLALVDGEQWFTREDFNTGRWTVTVPSRLQYHVRTWIDANMPRNLAFDVVAPMEPLAPMATMPSKGHKHAALMALYAADAAEHTAPWLLWEARFSPEHEWVPLDSQRALWFPGAEYRRKPRTIRIGDVDVPEPLREAPAHWAVVWRIELALPSRCLRVNYDSTLPPTDLRNGLLHATQEAAALHAEALIALSATPT